MSRQAGESVLELLERLGAPRPSVRLTTTERLGPGEARSQTHYTFDSEIDRGGVGVVIQGTDVDLGRQVALKMLREEYVDHPQVVARFVEEAQIEGQLQHPSIVPVYELGMAADGRPFFAMKLVSGKTLGALLAGRKTPREDRRRLLAIFEQVCQAMAYAHARGVVHRDLKPDNVMVGSFGEVQVVDWGLAKVLGRAERPVRGFQAVRTVGTDGARAQTRVGAALGTPSYMPPEQALGSTDEVDERSDVFSLGALLLEILTGAPPYPADAPDVLDLAARARLADALARLDDCDSDPELKALCRSCLARERMDRPRDAKALAVRVGAYLAGVEERARLAELEAAKARVKAKAERRARRLTAALAGTLILAGLMGGGGYLWRQSDLRAREERAGRAVTAAIEDAQERRGEARKAPVERVDAWDAAREAARRAAELAQTGSVRPEMAARAHDVLAQIETEYGTAVAAAERAALDRATVRRLADIRSRRGTFFPFLKVENDYADVFRTYGLDLEAMDVDGAASAIARSPIAAELCAALDEWALVRNRYDDRQAERAKALRAIASAADPDALRVRLRELADTRDVDQLRALRAQVDPRTLGPAASLLFARTLASVEGPPVGIALLQATAAANPDDFWTHYQLGVWLLAEQPPRGEEALGHLLAAVAIRPDSADAWLQLGHALRMVARWDDAIAVFGQALALRPDKLRPYVFIIDCMLQKGELEAYLAALEREAQQAPGDPVLQYRIGLCYGRLEQHAEAIRHQQMAVSLDPDFGLAYASMGLNHFFLRQYAEAEEPLRQAALHEPWHALWWTNLGGVLSNLGKYDESLAAYEQALRCAPDGPYNHVRVVSAKVDTGDFVGAMRDYQELARRFGEHLSLVIAECALARKTAATFGQTLARHLARKAIERTRRQIELSPAHVNYYELRIATLNCEVLDDFEAAARTFEEQDEWFNLGIARERLGLVEAAVEAYGKHLASGPGSGQVLEDPPQIGLAHYRRGYNQHYLGRLEEAERSHREAVKLLPQGAWCQANLAIVLLSQGRFDEAREAFQRYYACATWREQREMSEAVWSRWCDAILASARMLDTLEPGEIPDLAPYELVMLGAVAWETNRPRESIAFFQAAFEADPTLTTQLSWWHEELPFVALAAYAAAGAASGFGGYAQSLAEPQAARARELARGWLYETLRFFETAAEGGSDAQPAGVLRLLCVLQEDAPLAVLREARHLGKLPSAEQDACRALWAEVQRVIQVVERRLPNYLEPSD